jgi:hypothetical protein
MYATRGLVELHSAFHFASLSKRVLLGIDAVLASNPAKAVATLPRTTCQQT